MKFSQLQTLEFIQMESGTTIGYVRDVMIHEEDGLIQSFVVGTKLSAFELFKKDVSETVVSLNQIVQIGKDVVLVKRT